MVVNWDLSIRSQEIYYLHQASQIANGFFQSIRAVVLPYLDTNAWYLPDIGLFDNHKLISSFSSLDKNAFEIENQALLDLVNGKVKVADTIKISHDKSEFEFISNKLFEYLRNLIPLSPSVSQITIVPTEFGTGHSYFYSKLPDKTYHITVCYRLDLGYQATIKAIVSCFCLIKYEQLGITPQWENRQAVCDFMFVGTDIPQIIGESINIQTTLEFLGEYKGNLVEESASYFSKLGFPVKSVFKYENNDFYYNDISIKLLTQKEKVILKTLIDNKSKTVSYEALSVAYWGDKSDEKFSLYSLSKIIEKLRKTLAKNNIPDRFICTVSKTGYLLYD